MPNKRIYQIAKELNISHIEIINFLNNNNIEIDGYMSIVNEDIYNSILIEFSKEKKQIDLLRSERARKAVIESKDQAVIEDKDQIDSQNNENKMIVKKEEVPK